MIISKNRTTYILYGVALLLCVMMTGGIFWQSTVIPLLLLIPALFLARGKVNPLISSVGLLLWVMMAFSAFTTMGDPQAGFYEAEKFLLFTVALSLGSAVSKDKLSKILFYTAFVVSVAGLLAYVGILDFDEFALSDRTIRRLQSFLKYANATACFLGCGYYAFLKDFENDRKTFKLFFGSAILVALYLTVSKACIPLFLLAGTVLIYKEKKARNIFIYQNVLSMVFLIPVLIAAQKEMFFISFVLVAVSVILGGLIKYDSDKDAFKLWLVAILIFTSLGTVLIIAKPLLVSSLAVRFDYMKDALSLILRNPITGCGTGSYRVLQFGVQSSGYDILYVHNGILQFLIENGFVFTIAFLALVIWGMYKAFRIKEYYLLATIFLIVTHSILDFDLSFGAILVILGAGLGGLTKGTEAKGSKILAIIIAIVAIVTSGYMTTEYFMRSGFEKAYLEGNYEEAKEKAQALERICPYDSELKVSLAHLERLVGGTKEDVVAYVERALEISPEDGEIYRQYISLTMAEGSLSEKIAKFIDLRPKQEETYVYVKKVINSVCDAGLISEEEKENLIKTTEKRRVEEGVIDRNQLLHQLVNN